MYITYITLILQLLHVLQSIYICITHFTSVVKNDLFCNVWAGNLLNVHKDVRGRPSTWFVACFLPTWGADSKWDDRGGNSKSVRSTELMMECNDSLWPRDHEGKREWLGSQTLYNMARREVGGVHLVFNPLPGIFNQDSHQQMFFMHCTGWTRVWFLSQCVHP